MASSDSGGSDSQRSTPCKVGEGVAAPTGHIPEVTNADARLACCRILGQIGGRGSLSALNGRGSDRDPRLERAARKAFYAVSERLKQAEQPSE